jgi:hypothetical protein
MASVESVPFSELQRRPTEALRRLGRARSLHLSRRDAEDLVLMYAARADAESALLETTTRLLVEVMRLQPQVVRQVLLTVLPWSRFLPTEDAEQLAQEFVAVAQASSSLENLAPLAQLLIEWQHTAEIHADPQLHAALNRQDLVDHGPVPVPDGA